MAHDVDVRFEEVVVVGHPGNKRDRSTSDDHRAGLPVEHDRHPGGEIAGEIEPIGVRDGVGMRGFRGLLPLLPLPEAAHGDAESVGCVLWAEADHRPRCFKGLAQSLLRDVGVVRCAHQNPSIRVSMNSRRACESGLGRDGETGPPLHALMTKVPTGSPPDVPNRRCSVGVENILHFVVVETAECPTPDASLQNGHFEVRGRQRAIRAGQG